MPASQFTILVAEDEVPLRELLRKILQATGYQVLLAADGKEALDASDQHQGPIHLLLSDIVMPEMTGVELARAITVRRPETEIILASAYPRHMWVMERSWHFIAKPYFPALMLDAVRQALNGRPAPVRAAGRDRDVEEGVA